MPLTPKNRKEEWLQGLVDHETTLTPKNRPEAWMKEIIDTIGSGGGGGTGGGVLKVGITVESGFATMDKTWKEINEATLPVVVVNTSENATTWMFVIYTEISDKYYVSVAVGGDDVDAVIFTKIVFSTDSETGYPVAQMK
ncbi:MAG: hypothetical protein II008_11445 [Oscillospiraceae bacterium]|nr:hypothetical protein [Oscillospiraceae bacterium]